MYLAKHKIPTALMSNVVYKFSCSRDVNMTYIGMSTRHLVTRAKDHIQIKSTSAKSAIHQHITSFEKCKNSNLNVKPFQVIRQCQSEYETKMQEERGAINYKIHTKTKFTVIYKCLFVFIECILDLLYNSLCVVVLVICTVRLIL